MSMFAEKRHKKNVVFKAVSLLLLWGKSYLAIPLNLFLSTSDSIFLLSLLKFKAYVPGLRMQYLECAWSATNDEVNAVCTSVGLRRFVCSNMHTGNHLCTVFAESPQTTGLYLLGSFFVSSCFFLLQFEFPFLYIWKLHSICLTATIVTVLVLVMGPLSGTWRIPHCGS